MDYPWNQPAMGYHPGYDPGYPCQVLIHARRGSLRPRQWSGCRGHGRRLRMLREGRDGFLDTAKCWANSPLQLGHTFSACWDVWICNFQKLAIMGYYIRGRSSDMLNCSFLFYICRCTRKQICTFCQSSPSSRIESPTVGAGAAAFTTAPVMFVGVLGKTKIPRSVCGRSTAHCK